MEIVDTKGKALSTDHKRAHDSERVLGVRNMLNSTMQELRKGWANDNAADPTGATRPNEAAIDQHYIERWVATCTTVMNSSDPVEVDPDAMKNWIAAQRQARQAKENMAKALHAIVDLEPMGFKLLGMHKGAAVWVSTECAVMLVPGGMTAIHTRPQSCDPEWWASERCMQVIREFEPDVALPDYTLGELMDFLHAQRRQRPTHPGEADMEVARKSLSPAT